MVEFEYWKDTLEKIVKLGTGQVAVVRDEPRICRHLDCAVCDLDKGALSDCKLEFVNWLFKEHVEKPKLTKRERKLCELFDGGWIVRDELGRLEYHQDYPHKSGKSWHSSSDCFFFSNFGKAVGATFDFIDCLEPWSIEKLLKLEVKEE